MAYNEEISMRKSFKEFAKEFANVPILDQKRETLSDSPIFGFYF